MLQLLEQFLLHTMPIGLRVAGIMTFAPFLGSLSISARVKAGLAFCITALLYPLCPVPQLSSLSPLGWTSLALGEAALGLVLGLCVQFVLEGAELAGQLAGFQLSFSLVNIIDPQSNVDTPVFSIFHQLFALLFFLQLNVHHWILRGLLKSFEVVPIGSVSFSLAAAKELFHAAGLLWVVGLQIATPLLLATLLIDVTVGFLSKAAPQMPAIVLSIPLKSLIGYAVLSIAVTLWPGLFEKQFAVALGWGDRLLHLAH